MTRSVFVESSEKGALDEKLNPPQKKTCEKLQVRRSDRIFSDEERVFVEGSEN